MAVGDKYRATIVGTLHGQTINTVLYYRESTNADAFGALGLATLVDNNIAANLVNWQAQEYTYLYTSVQKFDPPPTMLPVVVATSTGNGGGGVQSLPSSVCATITKQTAFAGRRYRGRIFLAGVPVVDEVNSELSPGSRASLATEAATLNDQLTDVGGNVFDPILWHRDTGLFNVITQIRVNPILRVQRRREIGKGS